jgi:hypothetical protein
VTVVVTAPTVTGSFDGFIYGADCSTFRGWAWDRNKPNTAISIDILDGVSVIKTLTAGELRQDLLDAGKATESTPLSGLFRKHSKMERPIVSQRG